MMDIKLAWRAWKTRFRDQVFELRAIRHALRSGGVAIDVGANKGSYLYSMARWAGLSQVVAFEPQRTLAHYLAGACQRSGLTNVTVENLALSNQAGELDLFVPGDSHSPGASLESSIADKTDCHKEAVTVTTLDLYAAEKLKGPVRVIKIDVEGHEFAVVQGALGLIRRDKPLLVIECEGRHMPAGKTVQEFIDGRWAYAACTALLRGDHEAALGDLERAFETRDPRLPLLTVLDCFAPLHSDPRFADLARRMNLPLPALPESSR